MATETPLECAAALSDLVLRAARQAIPANVDSLMQLPDCGPLNQPLVALLVALLDAAKVTASAIADNAWDSGQPIDMALATELVTVADAIRAQVTDATSSLIP